MSDQKMRSLTGNLLFVAVFSMLAMALLPLGASSQQVWFSSGDDLNVKGPVAHPDFMQLFAPDAPWPTGMARINVMQLRAPWFLRMPAPAVQQVTDFLKQHNIALAVPLGFVSSDTCGEGWKASDRRVDRPSIHAR
jgi:hypothetical protein